MISIWGTNFYAKLNVLTREGTNKFKLLNKRLCCDDDGDYNFGLAITQIFTELRTYQIAHYIDHTRVSCMLSRARATPRIACFCKCLLICFSYVLHASHPLPSSIFLSSPHRSCFSWLSKAIIIDCILDCWCFTSLLLLLMFFFSSIALYCLWREKLLWADCLCFCNTMPSNMIWKWERETYN